MPKKNEIFISFQMEFIAPTTLCDFIQLFVLLLFFLSCGMHLCTLVLSLASCIETMCQNIAKKIANSPYTKIPFQLNK